MIRYPVVHSRTWGPCCTWCDNFLCQGSGCCCETCGGWIVAHYSADNKLKKFDCEHGHLEAAGRAKWLPVIAAVITDACHRKPR